MKPTKPNIYFKKINDVLTVELLLFAVYIMIAPSFPKFTYFWNSHTSKHAEVVVASTNKPKVDSRLIIPKGETLLIPSIFLDETIHEGKYESTLRQGVWRLPLSSTPENGSNTVIAGHRFYYTSTAVFYNLDKVQTNDKLTLNWNGKAYVYKVFSIRTVAPSDVSVEAPTKDPTLTLYTCTPLWTSKYRLVVQAHLETVIS